jgi:hypothetical protein
MMPIRARPVAGFGRVAGQQRRRPPGQSCWRTAQGDWASLASPMVGSNSSTGLPDGSSTRICLPPTPVTISLRKVAPLARRSWTVATKSGTSIENRFQPPGSGTLPVGHRLAAARRVPGHAQYQAQVAPGEHGEHVVRVHQQAEPEKAGVKANRRVDVVDDIPDADRCHVPPQER